MHPWLNSTYVLHNFKYFLGIEWTSSWRMVTSVLFNFWRMTSWNALVFNGECCSTHLYRILHRCSRVLRLGEILVHWRIFILGECIYSLSWIHIFSNYSCHIRALPPPNFTVRSRHFLLYSSSSNTKAFLDAVKSEMIDWVSWDQSGFPDVFIL